MVTEDNTFVIEGLPPLKPLPEISVGQLIYDGLKKKSGNEKAALIDAITEKTISYMELFIRTCSLAKALTLDGYRKNDIFAISSENTKEFIIPVISSLFIGATIAPINHNYTESELIHTLNISKPKLLFVSSSLVRKFVNLKLGFIKKIIVIDSDDNVGDIECLNSYTKRWLPVLVNTFQVANVDPKEDVVFILCSSGTTGLPKGVMITHRNAVTKFVHLEDSRLSNPASNYSFGLLPFFHAYGLFVNLMNLHIGSTVVVVKKFEEHLFLRCIEKYRISGLSLVPPLVVFLAKSPLVDRYDLSSVTMIGSGAAPLSMEIENRVKQRLKVKTIRQGYGLTEVSLSVIQMPKDEERRGSSGIVIPYVQCKVRDPETGRSLGPNQVGELCFKGPLIMKGYYGNEEETKNAFTSDGWLLTGDLGYYDEDKYFYIVDRLKELIKYKAFQVAPAELEAVLLTNPQIQDAGVVGLPDEEAGELPLAFVVKAPNSKLTEKEVEEFVAAQVSPQKRLRGGVIFVDSIPKNLSGKILRRELRDLLKKYKSKL